MKFYLCSVCKMYHKVGFDPARDTAFVEDDKGAMVEPPAFVWRKSKLPDEAEIVEEPGW